MLWLHKGRIKAIAMAFPAHLALNNEAKSTTIDSSVRCHCDSGSLSSSLLTPDVYNDSSVTVRREPSDVRILSGLRANSQTIWWPSAQAAIIWKTWKTICRKRSESCIFGHIFIAMQLQAPSTKRSAKATASCRSMPHGMPDQNVHTTTGRLGDCCTGYPP